MRQMGKISRWLLGLGALLTLSFLLSAPASAASPTTMSFQGKVVNANGTNVADGNYTFLFKMYTVSSAGTAVWTETQSSVAVTAGIFQVNLGSSCSFFTANACNNNTPLDFNTLSSLYLGITFNGDAAGEMTPRVQLQSVPFAYNADKVGGLAASQLVQLSPSSQQAGNINVSGSGTFGTSITAAGITSTGGMVTFTQAATDIFKIQAAAVPTTDMVNFTNVGFPITGDGINAQQIDYYAALSNAAYQTSALRVNITNTSTVAGSTTDALRLVVTTSTSSGVVNGLRIDAITAGTGVASAINVGTGWTNVIQSTKFTVANATGNITAGGSITAGYFSDINATETATTTYTEATPALAYYLSSNSGTTNAAITTTFNITGLPATDGTFAFITGNSAKGVTGTARIHTVIIQIAGTTVSTITNASSTTAATNTRSFTVARMNGVWQVVGSGLAATPATASSTVNTADFAEWVHYSGSYQPQPGDVLSVGDEPESVKHSTKSYDATAIGVVSTDPYSVASQDDGHSVVMALAGRVPVNVSLENGPIAVGDYLTASSTPGFAMKATKSGPTLGTALTSYDGTQATAQITLQLGIGYRVISPIEAGVNDTIITGKLSAEGALSIDAGTPANVVATGAEASIAIGSNDVSSLAVSNEAPSLKDDAIRIDNPSSSTVVAAAIKVDNSGGAGYTDIFSSPSFTVTGKGDVRADGSLSAKGGFTLVDAGGSQTVRIDQAGNADFNGALNMANAAISGGLSVGGDVNIAGLSNFQKLATFFGKTVFRQDVSFQGHVTVSNDSAGYALVRSNEKTVHVSFKNAYEAVPIVNVTPVNGQFVVVALANITKDGFDIALQTPATTDLNLSWTATGVIDPLTAQNPLIPAESPTVAP
ncbi:MAG: hypothetical protein JWM81_1120 [Candidatus Saccharibacteria bacterium]|nr:hypothetical protein [Candidatus Saccharibacteria bacterium]